MARITTTNLSLGTWAEGDNPGAGSQTVASIGLNNNWLILDTAIGTALTAGGALKDDSVHKAALHSDCADGTTLEKSVANDYLQIKALGVDTAQIKDDAVTAAKVAADVAGDGLGQAAGGALKVNVDESTLTITADTLLVKDLGVTSGKLAADAVIAGKIANGAIDAAACFAAGVVDSTALGAAAVTAAKLSAHSVVSGHIATSAIDDFDMFAAGVVDNAALASDAVTSAKISHDNKRTQQMFTLAFTAVTDTTYAKCNGELTSATTGVPMPQAGSVIAISWANGGGQVNTWSWVYGTYAFAQGNKLSLNINNVAAVWNLYLKKNGSNFIYAGDMEIDHTPSAPAFVTICVEFDD